jgi:hypothetical protein
LKKFRTKTLQDYDLLSKLFDGTVATGLHAHNFSQGNASSGQGQPSASPVGGKAVDTLFSPNPDSLQPQARAITDSDLDVDFLDDEDLEGATQLSGDSAAEPPPIKRRRLSATGGKPPAKPKSATTTPKNGAFAIAEMMGKYIEMQNHRTHSIPYEAVATQNAITLLNGEYLDVLDSDQLAAAYEVMQTASNAIAFQAIGKGEPRDKWLLRCIEKTL